MATEGHRVGKGGMLDSKIGLSHSFGSDWNLFITVGWMTMKLCADVYVFWPRGWILLTLLAFLFLSAVFIYIVSVYAVLPAVYDGLIMHH